jgi:hypothetical protein
MVQFLFIDTIIWASYYYFNGRGPWTKTWIIRNFKRIGKDERTSNYNLSNVVEDYIMYNHIRKIKIKINILSFIGKTNKGGCPRYHIEFGPKRVTWQSLKWCRKLIEIAHLMLENKNNRKISCFLVEIKLKLKLSCTTSPKAKKFILDCKKN